jgi:RimJ/RimL family protein N-acetyltransferase
MAGETVIETARLLLRRWRPEDLEPFAAMNADPEVMRHFPAPLDRAESDAIAARMIENLDRRGYGWWVAEVKETASFAGCIALSVPSFEAHFTPCVEIGWRLARAHWRRGYAVEGATAALRHGFTTVGLEEIVSFTTPANERSWQVMQRIGMHRDPADDFDHPSLPEGHRVRRHLLYRLTCSEWQAQQKS